MTLSSLTTMEMTGIMKRWRFIVWLQWRWRASWRDDASFFDYDGDDGYHEEMTLHSLTTMEIMGIMKRWRFIIWLWWRWRVSWRDDDSFFDYDGDGGYNEEMVLHSVAATWDGGYHEEEYETPEWPLGKVGATLAEVARSIPGWAETAPIYTVH